MIYRFMKRIILLSLVFLLATLSLFAQREYKWHAPSDYRSDTLRMDNYTYVCDTLPEYGNVCLFNIENHPGRDNITYLNGDPIPINPWDSPDWYVITPEMEKQITNIVNNAFSAEQVEMLDGKEFSILFDISSVSGHITDVYFNFFTFSPYVNIPVDVFRQMEVEFKSNIVFELTDEGKKLTYCGMFWWDCPTNSRDDTLPTPGLPFDGSGGGGEGNVQTGPRGSIATEPMRIEK